MTKRKRAGKRPTPQHRSTSVRRTPERASPPSAASKIPDGASAGLGRTVADEIQKVVFERPHVVLLGAGASRAAYPDGDANGRRLPLMADLVATLELDGLLKGHGIEYNGRNFEELYARICLEAELTKLKHELEERVYDYFRGLRCPPEPTVYDYLLLSLRGKDLIATFN